jgi:hypothetical protein
MIFRPSSLNFPCGLGMIRSAIGEFMSKEEEEEEKKETYITILTFYLPL